MRCPRCRGYMLGESDSYGEWRSCLVCGYVSYDEPPNYTRETNRGRKVERLRGRTTRRRRYRLVY